jgi:hypothetical protein
MGIDIAIDFGGVLFVWVMNASCQVHYCINFGKSFAPIGLRANRVDNNRIWISRGPSLRSSDDHTVGR